MQKKIILLVVLAMILCLVLAWVADKSNILPEREPRPIPSQSAPPEVSDASVVEGETPAPSTTPEVTSTPEPSVEPTPEPTPSAAPTLTPTPIPTSALTPNPTPVPTPSAGPTPTPEPTNSGNGPNDVENGLGWG